MISPAERNRILAREYRFLRVDDVMQILSVGKTKAYEIIADINAGLEAEGWRTQSGRVSEKRFCEVYNVGKYSPKPSEKAKPGTAAKPGFAAGRGRKKEVQPRAV